MITSPQTIQVRRDGVRHTATISWRMADRLWVVALDSPALEPVEAGADDAFEALCLVRAQLEPRGWRIGVAGAQPGVWPSGMARDQGGGLSAYRMSGQRVGDLVDTFEPVDPTTVTTVAQQRAEADRLFEQIMRAAPGTDDDPDVRLPGPAVSDRAAELVRALIENLRDARDDWASLAMVIDLRGGRVGGTHGYAYSPDGSVSAVASRPSAVDNAVRAFLDGQDEPRHAPPVTFLVQVHRSSGSYEVTFEHDDAARWKVTPANIEQIGEALRPNLD